ncbi:MAG: patatin family protein [Butyrivibrio sp.]|nr:patatin family protein [Butyrivibrio sp.]
MENKEKTDKKVKTGLVMEGGAMRGLFTAGVIDVMMENGITFDGAFGVSAGAAFGCNIKSRQPGRVLRYTTKYCKDWRFASFRSLLKTGDIYGAEFCYKTIPYELDLLDFEEFTKNPMEFYAVCTDIETGRPFYHKFTTGMDKDMYYFMASASMPIVSKVIEVDGKKLLDGGISDSIPIKYCEHKGFNKNVVILTQPVDFVKKPNKFLPLMKVIYKNYPEMIEDIKVRHIRYNNTTKYIKQKELAGELFVIRPPKALNIGSIEHNPEEIKRVYNMGRDTMTSLLYDLRRYLAK